MNITAQIAPLRRLTATVGAVRGGGGGKSDHRIVDAGLYPIVNTLTPKIVTVSGKIGALSGTPPLTFQTSDSKLYDYVVYGARNGVGDYVGDSLFDVSLVQGSIDSTGAEYSRESRLRNTEFMALDAGTYKISVEKSSSGSGSLSLLIVVFLYNSETNEFVSYYNSNWGSVPYTITLTQAYKVRMVLAYSDYTTTITPDHIERVTIAPAGADAPTITDGYAIPVTVTSKNLLENNFQSETYHGLTVTVNDDKSITVNGTATATTTLALHDGSHTPTTTAQEIENGTYYLSGVPEGAETGTYTMSYRYTPASGGSSQVGRIPVEGMTLDNTSGDYRYLSVYIAVWGGVTVDNVTFYPMLRKSGTADGYEPQYKNTVTVPIDKPLCVGETVSLSDSGVNIPTLPNGTNTLSVGTTVAPAEVYIRYRTTS